MTVIFDEVTISKVRQICNEDRQSRKNIRAEVTKDILEGIADGLATHYQASIDLLVNWVDSPSSYDSKHERKAHLSLLNIPDIVTELFIAVSRHTKDKPIQVLVHELSMHLDHDDVWEGLKLAGEIIAVCADIGIYRIIKPANGSGEYITLHPILKLDPEIQMFIDKTMYMNPLVCKPRDWVSNTEGGYLSVNNSILLGKRDTHHELKQAYDALNIAQAIEWELDEYILEFIEEPNKAPENREVELAFDNFADVSAEVYQDILDQGNKFFFQSQYDYRGRMYTAGYYINLQSTSFKKAVLNFAHKELIT